VFVSQASRHLFVPAFARYSGVLVAIEAMALARGAVPRHSSLPDKRRVAPSCAKRSSDACGLAFPGRNAARSGALQTRDRPNPSSS
jgi:hypothetical protein